MKIILSFIMMFAASNAVAQIRADPTETEREFVTNVTTSAGNIDIDGNLTVWGSALILGVLTSSGLINYTSVSVSSSAETATIYFSSTNGRMGILIATDTISRDIFLLDGSAIRWYDTPYTNFRDTAYKTALLETAWGTLRIASGTADGYGRLITGSLGLGVATPTETLHVNGNSTMTGTAYITGDIVIDGLVDGHDINELALSTGANKTIIDTLSISTAANKTIIDTLSLSTAANKTIIDTLSVSTAANKTIIDTLSVSTAANKTIIDTLSVSTAANKTIIDTLSLSTAAIDTALDVLEINTLWVSSDIAWTGVHSFASSVTFSSPYFSVGGTTLAISGGKVNIGRTTFAYELEVYEAANPELVIKCDSADCSTTLMWYNDTNTWEMALYGSINNNLILYEGATDRMVWEAGGNVGIGILDPTEKLHVIGNSSTSGNAYLTGNLVVDGLVDGQDINALAVSSGANKIIIDTLSLSTAANKTIIDTLSVSTATNAAAITVLQISTGTNETAISTLQASTGTNQTNITTNASAITVLQISTGTNEAAITSNDSDISTLQASTGTNEANIATHIADESGAHGGTSVNTASKLVERDGSGDFSAGVITASLTGDATGDPTVSTISAQGPDGIIMRDDGGTLSLFIQDGGNIGIKTLSPDVDLHIYDSAGSASLFMESNNTLGNSIATVKNSDGDTGNMLIYGRTATGTLFGLSRSTITFFYGDRDTVFGSYGDYPVIFGQNNAEVMRINTSGQLGINTTTPSYDFHVVGNAYITSPLGIGVTPIAVMVDIATNTTNTLLRLTDKAAASDGVGPEIDFNGTTGVNSMGRLGVEWEGSATTDSRMLFSTRDNNSLTEHAVITSSGRVGIGVTNPTGDFQVTNGSLTVLQSGYVGIGRTAVDGDEYLPGNYSLLTVGPGSLPETGYGQLKVLGGQNTSLDISDGTRMFTLKADTAGTQIDSHSTAFQFQTDGLTRMTIMNTASDGNIGIATTDPESALQMGVLDNATTSYFQLDNPVGGAPIASDCDAAAEGGRVIVDLVGELLYICMETGGGEGWDSIILETEVEVSSAATAVQVVNNNEAHINSLAVALVASTEYHCEIHTSWLQGNDAGADIDYLFDFPANATGWIECDATGTGISGDSNLSTDAEETFEIDTAANGNGSLDCDGTITTDGAASFILTWAQNAAAAVDTTMRTGSWIDCHAH